MTIVTAFFDRNPKYKKLLDIFKKSAAKHMPEYIIDIQNIVIPKEKYIGSVLHDHHWDTYYAFMAKITRAIEINDNVLMSDSDILFINSVNDIWQKNFDIAITIRKDKHKYNTGICFVKNTEAAKAFFELWKKLTKEIADRFDTNEFMKWWGIDQTSLHYALEENNTAKIIEIPCNIWNAEQTSWRNITDDTRIIHIKSGLRRIILNNEELKNKHLWLKPIIERIKEYEN